METRYLYASVTSSGALSFDMPRNGTIKGVQFAATCSGAAAGDYLELELSRGSTNSIATSDSIGIIAIATLNNGGTAGAATVLSQYMPADAAIKAGERVYLNYTENGTSTWRVRCLVYFT